MVIVLAAARGRVPMPWALSSLVHGIQTDTTFPYSLCQDADIGRATGRPGAANRRGQGVRALLLPPTDRGSPECHCRPASVPNSRSGSDLYRRAALDRLGQRSSHRCLILLRG